MAAPVPRGTPRDYCAIQQRSRIPGAQKTRRRKRRRAERAPEEKPTGPQQKHWICPKYDSDITVEMCIASSAAENLRMYFHKGPSRDALEIGNGEIKAYLGVTRFPTKKASRWLAGVGIQGGAATPVARLRVRIRGEQAAHFQGGGSSGISLPDMGQNGANRAAIRQI